MLTVYGMEGEEFMHFSIPDIVNKDLGVCWTEALSARSSRVICLI